MKVNYKWMLMASGGALLASIALVISALTFSSELAGAEAQGLPVIEGPLELAAMDTGFAYDVLATYKAQEEQAKPKKIEKPVEFSPSFEDIYAYIERINQENQKSKYPYPPLTSKEITRIIRAVEKWCVKYDTNKVTIFSMITVESRYTVRIPSRKGAKYGRGLLQVSEIALKDFNLWNGTVYTTGDLYNIEKNIEVGIWAFNQNYSYGVETKFEHGAIIAYNVGVGDYKSNKDDLLKDEFKGSDYDYLTKVKKQYGILTAVPDGKASARSSSCPPR